MPTPTIVVVLPVTVATLASAMVYVKAPVLLEVAVKLKSDSPNVFTMSLTCINGVSLTSFTLTIIAL